MVRALDSESRVPCSKLPVGSKVDSAFHPSEVYKVSTRNFWERMLFFISMLFIICCRVLEIERRGQDPTNIHDEELFKNG